jgi:hypothetical protein
LAVDRRIITIVKTSSVPLYLKPYVSASEKYGSGFGTLLWASPQTQALRFKALLQAVDVHGKNVLDVGCGRADLLDYMLSRGRFPRSYTGIEAVDALATAAEKKRLANCQIVRGDFVEHPEFLEVSADVLFYSGSLNTMDADRFYNCLGIAFSAARQTLVFNFLASPFLAASSHLTWHKPEDVLHFARGLSRRVGLFGDYLRGDATISMWKEPS